MKCTTKMYLIQKIVVVLIFYTIIGLLALACAASLSSQELRARSNGVLAEINALRAESGLEPLQLDEALMATALEKARKAAERGAIKQEEDPLPLLVQAGIFARFALSHQVQDATLDKAAHRLSQGPLGRSKIMHPPLTHVGFGFVDSPNSVFATMDLARLIPKVTPEEATTKLAEIINEKRVNMDIAPVQFHDYLNGQAQQLVTEYMAGSAGSDELIARAQNNVDGQQFSLGQITIAFQVTRDLEETVIPAITADPKISFIGLGALQANHKEHEPGSIAVAIVLARPQSSHAVDRDVSKLPPPKAVPINRKPNKGSLVDQAWIATLTGNHRKAASYFYKAYQQKRDPKLLYESARAHARDEDNDQSLKRMKEYAALVSGEEKSKAEAYIAALEKGESIFSKSEKSKLSVESKRFFVIGQRLYEQEQWEGAIDAFQQAYAYTKHPDIIYNIGLSHCRAGNISEALDFFDEYLKYVQKAENTEEAKQFFQIGVELYQAGQFEAASRNFALSYAFLPFPELVYNLALCHKAMGQQEEALRFLNEFLDTEPDQAARAEAEKLIETLSK